MPEIVDVIVVGSGPSGTSAALPLVEAGLSVIMLDAGHEDTRYAGLVPDLPFLEIRRTDPEQHRYFLGDAYEGIAFGRIRTGAQLTPPRRYISQQTAKLAPLESTTFFPIESLALGGLAAGWGATAVQYNDRDLAEFPISYSDLAAHYEAVSARIGISGERDDLLPYLGDSPSLQPAVEIDANGRALMERYQRRRSSLGRAGFYLGHPRLAVLSRSLGNRKAQQGYDMDFYADNGRSVYRPRYTVEEMSAYSRFQYVRPFLAERFRELPGRDGVEVAAVDTRDGEARTFVARRLVLAAGTLGTVRIVLRSFGLHETRLPIVSNPYTYIPCVNLRMVGRRGSERRHSLAQASFVLDPRHDGRPPAYGQAYSYRSLLHFRLVKEIALPVREGLQILRDLLDSLVIVGVFHEDRPSDGKYCVLQKERSRPGDRLHVSYVPDKQSELRRHRMDRAVISLLRKLGCWAIRVVDPGYGASIHYGGTLPMTREERPLTVTPSCLLRGTNTVYVVDGSVLPYLPSKPLTLTLMANADRVAKHVVRLLQ